MLDLHEFTERVVYDNLIRLEEIDIHNDEINECLKKDFESVPDDYDQDSEYGLYTGDSENARNHLMGILKLIYQNIGTVSQWENEIERDLSNWLSCIDIFEYDDVLPEVLRMMVYIGYGEVVCKQLEREYSSYDEFREEALYDETWIPDYVELYMELGDYCLFAIADDKLAMKFYHLAASDWYGVQTDYKAKISEMREKKVKRIAKLVMELDNCYDLLAWQVEKKGLPKKIVDTYNEYIKYRDQRYTYPEKVLKLLLEFSKYREKYWKNASLQTKRMLLIISHRLFENAIAEIVVISYDEKMDFTFQKRILDCLSKSEDISFISIRRLVTLYREEPEIMKAVVFLMRTKLQIKEVLVGLKMDGQKETLAYYTSLETFCYMLPDWNKSDAKGIDRFSVMNIAYMNDPNEGKILKNAFQQTDRSGWWRQHFAQSEGVRKCIEFPYAFMKCFTPLVDDLPMWDMYGDSAKGCCVVLDPRTFFAREKNYARQLYRVCYLSIDGEKISIEQKNNTKLIDEDSIEEALAEIRDIGAELFQKERGENELYHQAGIEFIEMLDQISYLFKSADYKHEQEVRLLYVYPQIHNDFHHTVGKWPKLYVRPDFPVYIKEIIMGPKCVETYKLMPYLQEQIAKMCEQEDIDMPRITISNIQYH